MSGYEYPGSIGIELVASDSWPNELEAKDSVVLRYEYNRVMQLERRLVFQTYVEPTHLAKGCTAPYDLGLTKMFNMSDYVTIAMRIDLLAYYAT